MMSEIFDRSRRNTNRHNTGGAALRTRLFTFALLTALVWGAIPSAVTGQTDSDPRNAKSGMPLASASFANKMASKMSLGSYSELMANTTNRVKSKAAAAGGSVTYAILNVEFKTPAARKAVFTDLKASTIQNAFVLTVIDQFADVFVSSKQAWDAISQNPGVLRTEEAARVTPPPPQPGTTAGLVSQAVPESIIRGGYKGLTGKNVNVAILDTGIDFRHPDFATTDGTGRTVSRLKYLWDTSLEYRPGRGTPAPFKYPNGASIGTLFTKDQLTTELRAATASIPATDTDGHGTACASIAAGNGRADKMAGGLNRAAVNGVAPDADIIGVRMGSEDSSFANSFMLGAIMEWLDGVAGTQPLVVSGSFGGHYTAHDGQTVYERQLNSRFPLTKASRAIVFAAGNEGSDRIHAKLVFGADEKLVTWTAAEETQINVYFNSSDVYQIFGTNVTKITKDNTFIQLNPITNQYHARISVPAGYGALWLKNGQGKPSEADLYFSDRSLGKFTEEYASYNSLVGTPGTTSNAITIGSYDWNDTFSVGGRTVSFNDSCGKPIEIGWLSCYSSPGPRRGSTASPLVVKPEIVSPGEYYPSANAKVNGAPAGWGSIAGYTDTTGNYRRMNGTSAATPYTAGVIALLFQKKPTLTLGRLRELLKLNVSKTGLNPMASSLPNNNWGYGKLDLAAIDRIFAALDKP